MTTATVFVCATVPLEHAPFAGQEVAEYEANALASSPSRKFVYADYIDEPVMMVNVSGGAEAKLYFHQNSLYSIAALTDQSGTVMERYAYSAYGEPIFLDSAGQLLGTQASTVGNDYLYTGRRLDAETALFCYRARYYTPRLGRFISRDPVQADINLYRYCGNYPINATDPSGEALIKAGPQDTLASSIADFLNFGPSNVWIYDSDHPVSQRFAKHPPIGLVWDVYDALDEYCCCHPYGDVWNQFLSVTYTATTDEFVNDLVTTWGLTKQFQAGVNDYGPQILGSFTYTVDATVDCQARTKSIRVDVFNWWSVPSVTREPFFRTSLINYDLANPVEVWIVMTRDGTINPKCK